MMFGWKKKSEKGNDEAAAKKQEKYTKKKARKIEESDSLTKVDSALARHKYAVLYRMPSEKDWRLIVTHSRADYLKDVAYVVKKKCYSITSSDNKHADIKEIIEDGGVVKHIGTGIISDMRDVRSEKKRQKREARMDELKTGGLKPRGMAGPPMDGDPGKPGSRYNPFTADKKMPKKSGSPKKPKKPNNGGGFDMDEWL